MWFENKLEEFLHRSEIRWRLPFTALTKALRGIDKSVETVLDVGCGKGFPARLLAKKGGFQIVGVDIFMPYLIMAKNAKAFQDLILADLRNLLPFRDKSFDAVICIEVIEHLKKEEGKRLLFELERVAKKKVIVTTPVGFVKHPSENGNPFSIHRSSWHPYEFKEMGYTVRGTAFRVGNPQNLLLRLLCYTLGVIFAPFAHFYPDLAFGMVAEKKLM
jgi:SAM-dependent methyltransferase